MQNRGKNEGELSLSGLRIVAELVCYRVEKHSNEQIKSMPTIDAVPVVRCKDCKYWDHGDCYRLELNRPDDFCNYGEVKEEIK